MLYKKFFKLLFVLLIMAVIVQAQTNYCLRFYGNGVNDIDRVKLPLDNPHRVIDVGESFTIEFQIKASLQNNPLGTNATEGYNDDWTLGHIILDRDIFGQGDYGDYGISLVNGRLAFGINNGTTSYTMISNTFVADTLWHYIAVCRNHVTTEISIFIDGVLDKIVNTGISGNISYRDNRDTQWPNDPFLVIGAEKHDYDNSTYPSFNGYFDELRISNIVRYTQNYTPQPVLTCDDNTVALYHLDEGQGQYIYNSCNPQDTLTRGTIRFGGNPAGPVWIQRQSQPTTLVSSFNSLKIYPLPAKDYIYVNQQCLVEIFDLNGNLLISTNDNPIRINHLSPGIYVVKAGNKFLKLVKK